MAHVRRVDDTICITVPGASLVIADGCDMQFQIKDKDGLTHSATVAEGNYTETTQTPIKGKKSEEDT